MADLNYHAAVTANAKGSRGKLRRILALGAVMLSLGACGVFVDRGGRAPTVEPSARSSVVQRAIGPGVKADVVSWPWEPVMGAPSVDSGTTPIFDGRYLTDTTLAVKEGVRIVDTSNGRAVVNHVPRAPGAIVWSVSDVWINAPWAVVEESAFDGKAPVRGYRYDLRTGARAAIGAEAGMPAPTNFLGWSVRDGLLTYASGSVKSGSCVVVVKLDKLSWSKRHCVPAKSVIDRTEVGPDGIVMFKVETWKELKFLEFPCARLYRLPAAGNGAPNVLPQAKECDGFSGVAGKNWEAWSESAVNSERNDLSQGYLREGTSKPISIGEIETGSIVSCGDAAYWEVALGGAIFNDDALLARWSPKRHLEVVYRGAAGSVLAKPQCADGRLTITENNLNTNKVTTQSVVPPA